ncbi:MAG: sulfatase-like hydrolase/transferase [Bacteroidales bacterium]|nr:sulfatase-like hydrolase/transferase [Bacteroidales bacterium]
MKINFFIVLFVLFCDAIFAQEQKPNIVMIAVDDLNDWIGAYGGHPQVKTPNIDKLAGKSMLFRNAACPGPVCGPSRSALLSGYMPSTTGCYGNADYMLNSEIVQKNPTMPEYFSKHGYITMSKGKIFHKHDTPDGKDEGQWAYDVWEPATGGGGIQADKFYSRDQGIINGQVIENALYTERKGSPFEFGPTEKGMEAAKDYITAKWFETKLQDTYDKPFFMLVGISKPHLPFTVPEEFFDMYGLDSIKVPDYHLDDLDDIVDFNGNKMFSPHPDFLWASHYDIQKEVTRAYMAAVSFADSCVGVVLDALENSEYADNTIVMLWGDHGWHLGEKLKYRKASLWREAVQLPFIVHVPGMTNGVECTRTVNLIDMYPTLIDLCGLPQKILDGKSIKPLLEEPKTEWTPTLTTYGKGKHSVMSEKWHYIKHSTRGEELYDLENDPMEWTNLAYTNAPEIIQIIEELRAYIPTQEENDVEHSSGNGDGHNDIIKIQRAETVNYITDATLSDLSIDGVSITDFSASNELYTIELAEGTSEVPVVTATATDENATVSVTEADSLPGTTSVLVTAEDSVTSKTYIINFTVAAPTVSIEKPQISNKGFVEIYPNPTNSVLNFRFQDSGITKKISIYNTFGQLLNCNQTKKLDLEIDVNSLYTKGILMIRVDSQGIFSYHRVVIN